MQQNDKLTDLQRDFKAFYDKKLRSKYEELELKRQQYMKKFKKPLLRFVAFAVVIAFLCVVGIIPEKVYSSIAFLYVCLSVMFFALYVCALQFIDYRAESKSSVTKSILSFWGKFSYSSSSKSKIRATDLRRSDLFEDFDRHTADDSFQGSYNHSQFCVSEESLLVRGEKSEHTIFKGIVILLGFNKNFKGQTVVEEKGRFFPLRNILSKCSTFKLSTLFIIYICTFIFAIFSPVILFTGIKYPFLPPILFICCIIVMAIFILYLRHEDKAQTVVLENADFNRKWNITADNQVEARYLLTPVFMEKITDIKKLFHGKHLDFSFFDNKLMIAVRTSKNMFETTSLLTSALDYRRVEEVVGQLYGIFSIIDILDIKNTTKTPSRKSAKLKTIKKPL